MPLLLQGLVIGFAIAAPVGAIGVLCVRRTLAHGWSTGLATGLGAATADAMYGAVAALGLTALAAFLNAQTLWLRIVGGAALVMIGWRTFMTRPASAVQDQAAPRLQAAYGSALALTLTNPSTILSFAAIFAGLGMAGPATGGGTLTASPLSLIAGVFLGSAAWWLALSTFVNLFRTRLTPAALRIVNRVAGVLIAGFGLVALASGLLLLGK